MKPHSPPIGSFTRSLIALAAFAFVAGIAHATPAVNKSATKAVPEKLIAPVDNVTLAATHDEIAISSSFTAQTLIAERNAIAPRWAVATDKNVIATNIAKHANVRFKEAVDTPNGASQTVTGANDIISATAANSDAWAADPPAAEATG